MSFFRGFEKQAARYEAIGASPEQSGYSGGAALAGGAGIGTAGILGGRHLSNKSKALSQRAEAVKVKAKAARNRAFGDSTVKFDTINRGLDRQEKRVMKPKNLLQRFTGRRDAGVNNALMGLDEARSRTQRDSLAAKDKIRAKYDSRMSTVRKASQKAKGLSRMGKGVRGLGAAALIGTGLYGYNKLRG